MFAHHQTDHAGSVGNELFLREHVDGLGAEVRVEIDHVRAALGLDQHLRRQHLLVGSQQSRPRGGVPGDTERRPVVDVLRTQVEYLPVVEVDDHSEVSGRRRPLLGRSDERPDGGVHQMAAGQDAARQLGVRTLRPAHLGRVHVDAVGREVRWSHGVVGIEHPRRPVDRYTVDLTRARRVVVHPEPERSRDRRIHGRRRRIVRRTVRVVVVDEQLVGLVRESGSHHHDDPARDAESPGDDAEDARTTTADRDAAAEQQQRDQEDRLHALGGAPPCLVGILHRHLTFL